MKSLLIEEKVDIPIKLTRAWVDRIDTWAERLGMSRNGCMRFAVKLSGPIIERLCQVIPDELRAACKRLDANSLFLALSSPCPPSETQAASPHERQSRRQARSETRRPSRRAQKPGGGQKVTAQARAEAETTTAEARSEARAGRRARSPSVTDDAGSRAGKG